MPPAPNVHVGVAAWVVRDGAALMIQRGGVGEFASDGHGQWSLPGGWLDFGEQPYQAAEREAMEEAGVIVEAMVTPAAVLNEMSDNGLFQIVTLIYECLWLDGEPRIMEPDKCPAVEWVPVREITQRPLFKPTASWVRRLEAIERASFRAA